MLLLVRELVLFLQSPTSIKTLPIKTFTHSSMITWHNIMIQNLPVWVQNFALCKHLNFFITQEV